MSFQAIAQKTPNYRHQSSFQRTYFMKTRLKNIAISFGFVVLLVGLFPQNIQAQTIVNDTISNAAEILFDSLMTFNVTMASLEVGETDLAIPLNSDCSAHGWCDANGLDGSTWFKFKAPASGAVTISLCGSTFDTQLAVFEVGDTTDFSTFTFLDASDDTPDGIAGEECGPADNSNPGYGLASELSLECLTVDEYYYIVVDEWLDGASFAGGTIVIEITEDTPTNPTLSITSTSETAPSCASGNDGTASISAEGVWPLSVLWENGSTELTATGLAAGTVGVTVTDYCGATSNTTITVPTGVSNTFNFDGITILPAYCHSGYASIGQGDNPPPLDVLWSTGETALGVWLKKGTHTVTITDLCSATSMVETVVMDGVIDAGGNVVLDTLVCTAELGGTPSAEGGMVTNSWTYSISQDLLKNVACREGNLINDNGFARVFDIATDFGATTDLTIEEVQFGVFEAKAGNGAGSQPLELRIYEVDNADLSVATMTLVETVKINLPDTETPMMTAFPVNYTIPMNQLVAFEIYNPNGIADGNVLALGQNEDATLNDNPTWLKSADCTMATYRTLEDLGQDGQLVMNIVEYVEPYTADNFTYSWSPALRLNDATLANPTLTLDSSDDDLLNPLVYTLTVTDEHGCSVSETITVDGSKCYIDPTIVSIVEPIASNNFLVAPNPNNGIFKIINQGQSRDVRIELFDLQGRLVNEKYINFSQGSTEPFHLSILTKGVYVLRLLSGNEMEVHRVVIQ